MTFLQYVNQVKLYHIYQDLLYTDGNIQEIMERHGMYNTKLFYKLFKKTYNCTPREIRLLSHENPYL